MFFLGGEVTRVSDIRTDGTVTVGYVTVNTLLTNGVFTSNIPIQTDHGWRVCLDPSIPSSTDRTTVAPCFFIIMTGQ